MLATAMARSLWCGRRYYSTFTVQRMWDELIAADKKWIVTLMATPGCTAAAAAIAAEDEAWHAVVAVLQVLYKGRRGAGGQKRVNIFCYDPRNMAPPAALTMASWKFQQVLQKTPHSAARLPWVQPGMVFWGHGSQSEPDADCFARSVSFIHRATQRLDVLEAVFDTKHWERLAFSVPKAPPRGDAGETDEADV